MVLVTTGEKKGKIKAFHVKCKYTNALLCTCAQGNRDNGGPGRSVLTTARYADKLWRLYNSGFCWQERGPSGDAVFRGVTCDVALPPLKPTFPLSDAKRTQGWTFNELEGLLGTDKADLLVDKVEKQRKQPISDRINLDKAKKILSAQRVAVENMQAKAEKMRADAEDFEKRLEKEFEEEFEEKKEKVEEEEKQGEIAKEVQGVETPVKKKKQNPALDRKKKEVGGERGVTKAKRKTKRGTRVDYTSIVSWLSEEVLREKGEDGQSQNSGRDGGDSNGEDQNKEDNGMDMLLLVGKEAEGLRVKVIDEKRGDDQLGTVVKCSSERGEVEVLFDNSQATWILRRGDKVLVLGQETKKARRR